MAAPTKVTAKPKKAAKTNTPVVPKFKTVQEYIAALPATTRGLMEEIRQTIRHVAPTAEEVISYNMPTFKLDGKGLICYAAWKEHISLYPRTRLMEAAIKELASYDGSKGTIKFPLTRPLPFDMIRKIIKFRMQEVKKAK